METNRIEELLRDPTLGAPEMDYWEVRTPWVGVCVTRESARRVLEAMTGVVQETWVRADTVEGSMVYIRAETVMYVREWTRAQRETGRQFWKEIDREEVEEPPPHPEEGEGEPDPSDKGGETPGGEDLTWAGVLLLVLAALGLMLSGHGVVVVAQRLLGPVLP